MRIVFFFTIYSYATFLFQTLSLRQNKVTPSKRRKTSKGKNSSKQAEDEWSLSNIEALYRCALRLYEEMLTKIPDGSSTKSEGTVDGLDVEKHTLMTKANFAAFLLAASCGVGSYQSPSRKAASPSAKKSGSPSAKKSPSPTAKKSPRARKPGSPSASVRFASPSTKKKPALIGNTTLRQEGLQLLDEVPSSEMANWPFVKW